MNRLGLAADLPPSINQSVSACSFDASMTPVFAAQPHERSSTRYHDRWRDLTAELG
jgi:hypothetical protein